MLGFVHRIPEGEDCERLVCADCGYTANQNPKIVTAAVVIADGGGLLCCRAIEPCRNFGTLPAGYLQLGETLEEGAIRETWEEAQVCITFESIGGASSISRNDHLHVMFRARVAVSGTAPLLLAGAESSKVCLFTWNAIPWDASAFPSVGWALDALRQSGSAPLGVPGGAPPDDARGVRPPSQAPAVPPSIGK